MKILSNQDRQIMEILINSNQKKTKLIVSHFLKRHYKKIIETKDYIFAEGDIPIALVAHMDTVFEKDITSNGRELYYDEKHNVMFSPHGAGFDDKAGVFAILQIIKGGQKPHVIFTTDEEYGALGAMKLSKLDCPFTNLKYIIQLDRRGSDDCVFYECDNEEFVEYIESFGFTWNYGSFTDISELCPPWQIAGVNLSVGYRDEHSATEVLFVGQLLSTISKVKKMLNAAAEAPVFKYIPMANTPYGKDWYTWNKNTYSWSDSNEVMKCHNCKKYFMEEELFPAVMLDKTTKFFCPDCLVDNVAWCSECGSAFEKYSLEAPSTGICPICEDLEEKIKNDRSKVKV